MSNEINSTPIESGTDGVKKVLKQKGLNEKECEEYVSELLSKEKMSDNCTMESRTYLKDGKVCHKWRIVCGGQKGGWRFEGCD